MRAHSHGLGSADSLNRRDSLLLDHASETEREVGELSDCNTGGSTALG